MHLIERLVPKDKKVEFSLNFIVFYVLAKIIGLGNDWN
tara:strand:+ start:623 stop:736 length:114 start_codon:yes stop_codon:yes gene_type:complete